MFKIHIKIRNNTGMYQSLSAGFLRTIFFLIIARNKTVKKKKPKII